MVLRKMLTGEDQGSSSGSGGDSGDSGDSGGGCCTVYSFSDPIR